MLSMWLQDLTSPSFSLTKDSSLVVDKTTAHSLDSERGMSTNQKKKMTTKSKIMRKKRKKRLKRNLKKM